MSKESAMSWKVANPGLAKALHKKWRDANKEKIAAWGKKYRETPKGKAGIRERQERWRAANMERAKITGRIGRHRRLKYPTPTRLCPDACECCGGPRSARCVLHLDHCHETGKFRGWLCFKCNSAIGKLGDTIEGLERGIAYLKRSLDS